MVFICIFITGSLSGYLIELFYTRLISKKTWENVGFLKGPYLPQYGFGAVIMYLVCSLDIGFLGRFFMFYILLSCLEYITGFIFIKKLGYKYWDYSKRKYNIYGLVCPLFSFIWATIGSVFYYTIYPLFQSSLPEWFILFSLLILEIIIIDFLIILYKKLSKITRKSY